MVKVNFIKQNETITVDVPAGFTLMEAARDYAQLPEIPGDCGGACACATCHVIVEPEWYSKLPPINQDFAEQDLLEYEPGYVPGQSRLGCQIQLTKEMDGLTVKIREV
jgi:2Fe-2S ferredoxin